MKRLPLRAAVIGLCLLAASVTHASAATSTFAVPAGWPKTLIIPAINVKAPVESVDLNLPSQIDAPHQWGDVAWYDAGAKPGDLGRASIFGHLDSTCCPAIFYHLKDLKAGDLIQVEYNHGKTLTFKVLWQAEYADAKIPTNFLFGPANERGLSLVTCAGVFHRDGTGYDHRLVVYARLLLPGGRLG